MGAANRFNLCYSSIVEFDTPGRLRKINIFNKLELQPYFITSAKTCTMSFVTKSA